MCRKEWVDMVDMLDVNMLLNTGWALLLNGYYPGGEGNGLIIILEIFKRSPIFFQPQSCIQQENEQP